MPFRKKVVEVFSRYVGKHCNSFIGGRENTKKPGSLEFVPDKSKARVVRPGGNMLHAHERRSVVVLERGGATGNGVRVSFASPCRRLAAVPLLVFFGLDADCTHPQPAHHEEVSYPKAIRRRKVP
jgi:hypothetical protein